MKIVRILLSLMVLALTASFLTSCGSSKIAFGNSYYFKQTPKKLATPPMPEEANLIASVEKQSPGLSSVNEKVTESLAHVITLAKDNAALKTSLKSQKKELTHSEKKSIRKERRENKREMRKEIKNLAQEYRSLPKVAKEKLAVEDVEDVTGNVRTGIIVGAVGLILLIIGGPVLYPVGAILVVVGLVLILIDIL